MKLRRAALPGGRARSAAACAGRGCALSSTHTLGTLPRRPCPPPPGPPRPAPRTATPARPAPLAAASSPWPPARGQTGPCGVRTQCRAEHLARRRRPCNPGSNASPRLPMWHAWPRWLAHLSARWAGGHRHSAMRDRPGSALSTHIPPLLQCAPAVWPSAVWPHGAADWQWRQPRGTSCHTRGACVRARSQRSRSHTQMEGPTSKDLARSKFRASGRHGGSRGGGAGGGPAGRSGLHHHQPAAAAAAHHQEHLLQIRWGTQQHAPRPPPPCACAAPTAACCMGRRYDEEEEGDEPPGAVAQVSKGADLEALLAESSLQYSDAGFRWRGMMQELATPELDASVAAQARVCVHCTCAPGQAQARACMCARARLAPTPPAPCAHAPPPPAVLLLRCRR